MSDRAIRRSTLGLLALLGALCAWRLDLSYSITHFLPSADRSQRVELWLTLVDSPFTRRMVLAVSGGAESRAAALELAASLGSHPEVAWVGAGFDEEAWRAIYELYFERRFHLASDEPEAEIPRMLAPQALARSAERLRLRLARPDAALVTRLASRDPLGLFERIVDRLREAQPSLARAAGGLGGSDGAAAIVQLGLRSSPFESSRQIPLLGDIEREFGRIAARHGGGLRLEQSGINRIAVAVENEIRSDVNFISAVSTSGVCVLFLLFFRSIGRLLVAILVPVGGFVAAAAVSTGLAGPIHGITVGFGFALIGVAIDYPIHLMTHHAFSPRGTRARETAAMIRSPLLLSAATTALAFGMLASSRFPGLQQMGLFAAVGVLAALALTLVALPSFLGPGGDATRAQLALRAWLVRLLGGLRARPRLAWAVPVAYAALVAFGLPQLRWEDDPSELTAADPALLAEDARVRALVSDADPDRFVVALAQDREAALALDDRIAGRLRAAVSAGALDGFRSLHSVLWSQDLQRRNLAAFRSEPDLDERVARAFTLSGFRPDAFQRIDSAIADPAPLLRPEDLVGSPLERALDALTQVEGRAAVVTALRGVHSGAGIRAALRDLEGAHLVDRAEIVGDLYRRYRRSTLRMVGLACGAMFLLLWARYRRLRTALLAFLPAGLVAATTLALLALAGAVVNVVSAVSLAVVLGMGVDYGIFSVDGVEGEQAPGAMLASLTLACLTTIFVFGTLALSAQPALRSIGLTTGTGVILALLLSPSLVALASARRDA